MRFILVLIVVLFPINVIASIFDRIPPSIVGYRNSNGGPVMSSASSVCAAIATWNNGLPGRIADYLNARGLNHPNYGWGCSFDLHYLNQVGVGNEIVKDSFYQNWVEPITACPSGYDGPIPLFGGSPSYEYRVCNRNTQSLPQWRQKECGIGNPVLPASGIKIETIRNDLSDREIKNPPFYRNYRSMDAVSGLSIMGRFGYGWMDNYDRKISIGNNGNSSSLIVAHALRDNGMIVQFGLIDGKWVAEGDVSAQLVQFINSSGGLGFRYTDAENGAVEEYSEQGILSSITYRGGYQVNLKYSNSNTPPELALAQDFLYEVSDNFGRTLNFKYDASGRVNAVTTSSGNTVSYTYDNLANLSELTYADGTKQQYFYEVPNFTHALTGLKDQNGVRFANYAYDTAGRAVLTEHVSGVDRYSLVFEPNKTTITDALGVSRIFTYEVIFGTSKLSAVSQPGGAGCSAATNGMTYDANGNVASRTDFNGNKTSYVYDLTRNLETSRTEAVGTPQVRTITTAWHPTWRLPATITEPGQITTYDYDAVTANLNSKTIAADGKTRVWTWTYFDKDLIKTAIDPDGKVTSYTYDIAGNLATLTNPLNQITQFTRYDANGNLLEMSAADGIKTTLTYDARNRLKTRQTGTALTSYDYWPTGLLKQAALPNGQVINYTYDGAHRLTGGSDNRGNTVTYRLNNLGQAEQVDQNDHDGTLSVGLAQAQQLQVPANAVAKVQ